jgi:hypothetical protein
MVIPRCTNGQELSAVLTVVESSDSRELDTWNSFNGALWKKILFVWDPKRTYNCKITDSKEQNPCKEANSRLAAQEITLIFWNPKVHHRASVDALTVMTVKIAVVVPVTSRNLVATNIWG